MHDLQSFDFLNLPKDMQNEVFSYLRKDWQSVKNCRSTCRLFNKLNEENLKANIIEKLKQYEVVDIYSGSSSGDYLFFILKNGKVLLTGHPYLLAEPVMDTTVPISTPIVIKSLKNVKSISHLNYTDNSRIYLILKKDGNVSIFYLKNNGCHLEKPLDVSQIKQIKRNENQFVFLNKQGEIYYCDSDELKNIQEQDNPNIVFNKLENIEDVKQINLQYALDAIEYLKNDGSVWRTQGEYIHNDVSLFPHQQIITNVKHFGYVRWHDTAYLKNDGTVWIGELLNQNFNGLQQIEIVQEDDVIQNFREQDVMLKILKDGTVKVNGNSNRLGLGLGNVTSDTLVPGLENVKSISHMENFYRMFIKLKNGKVLVYGDNFFGELGLGHRQPLTHVVEHPYFSKWATLVEEIEKTKDFKTTFNEKVRNTENISGMML